MSLGIDCVAGMLRRLWRQQLICFNTGVQLMENHWKLNSRNVFRRDNLGF